MKNTPEIWKVKNSEEIADCKIFKIKQVISESSDGKEGNFFVIENPDWVNVIALTKEQQIVVIEQFRHGTGDITLEIPGGMVDDGENAGEAAERELIEETGFVPRETILIGKSRPNPAIQDNWVYHYLAVDCEKKHEPEFDATESVLTKLVPFEEVKGLIADGRITHSLVIAAFHWLSLRNTD